MDELLVMKKYLFIRGEQKRLVTIGAFQYLVGEFHLGSLKTTIFLEPLKQTRTKSN